MRYRFVKARATKDGSNIIMTLIETPGFLWRLIGREIREIKVYGECTVWYWLPTYKRLGTFGEALMCEFWTMARAEGLIEKGDL